MIDLSFSAEDYLYQAEHHKFYTTYGKVSEVVGLVIKAEGLSVFVGEICEVAVKGSDKVALAEVVGFVKETVLLMPLDELEGIGPGCIVKPTGRSESALSFWVTRLTAWADRLTIRTSITTSWSIIPLFKIHRILSEESESQTSCRPGSERLTDS